MSSKLDKFISHAKETQTSTTKAVYLVVRNSDINLWGLLYVSEEGEESDNHCQECQEEPIDFFCFKFDENSNVLIGNIGPTKFQKIETYPNILGGFHIKQQLV